MKLAVGAVVSNRSWILPTYFDYLHAALDEYDPTYIFLYGPSLDTTALDLARGTRGFSAKLLQTDEDPSEGVSRSGWDYKRVTHLTDLRNQLMTMVREVNPDYFLSIDSDILLHRKTLPNLLETMEDAGAVGGKCYMSRSKFDPSYAMLDHPYGGLRRSDDSGVFPVDVIMALKLMSRDAYHVDYVYDSKGEDIGWSVACREAGVRLKWDGRVINKHVIRKELLYSVDPRCGY